MYLLFWTHEWTNPLLNAISLRSYCTKTAKRNSKPQVLIEFYLKLLYVAAFCVLRFGLWVRMAVDIVFELECSVYLQVVATGMVLVSVAFLLPMVLDLRGHYAKWKGMKEMTVSEMVESGQTKAGASKDLENAVPQSEVQKESRLDNGGAQHDC